MPDQPVRVVCRRCKGKKVLPGGRKCGDCWHIDEDAPRGTILATLADPEMAALIEDGRKWRALADNWEYTDDGGEIVALKQEYLWARKYAPGSEEAAIAFVVAKYAAPPPPDATKEETE